MSSFLTQQIGFSSLQSDFGPDWDDDGGLALDRETHRLECAAEIELLDGAVGDLMEWFHEESEEYETIKALVAKAAEEKAQMDLERERFDADQYSPI